MNSLLEIVKVNNRDPEHRSATAGERTRDLSALCRELLADARALDLSLEDIIEALRRSSTLSQNSN
jgi:hypothetical protein